MELLAHNARLSFCASVLTSLVACAAADSEMRKDERRIYHQARPYEDFHSFEAAIQRPPPKEPQAKPYNYEEHHE